MDGSIHSAVVRALVTGATGFVGVHLVAHLEQAGDEVEGVDRVTGGPDITDASAMRDLLLDLRPEAVYHLAGWSDVGGSWSAPQEAFRANAEGTLNVLQASIEAGVHRVLVVSSADVYGAVPEDRLPLTEDSPLRPVSPYAASKVAADFLGLQAFLGRHLGVVRARSFNHLGPGQSEQFVAPGLACRIARNERDGLDSVPVGNLSARRDFTDVRDVVRAYRLLVERGEPGEVYNVCSGTDVAVKELADQLIALAARPMHLVHDPELERPVEVPVLRGDNSRVRAATGWAPEIPLSSTLADLFEDCRSRMAAEAVERARRALTRARASRRISRSRTSSDSRVHRQQPALPLVQDGTVVDAAGALEPRQVVRQQLGQQLDVRVPRRHGRQPLGLGGRVLGAGDQVAGLDLEQPGQQHHRALARMRHPRLEVRHRRAGDGQALRQLLLRPPELRAQLRHPPAEVLEVFGHVPTHFADGTLGKG